MIDTEASERQEEVATNAVADFSAAVGAARIGWGHDDVVDVILALRQDLNDDVIFAVDIEGVEYDVRITRRD